MRLSSAADGGLGPARKPSLLMRRKPSLLIRRLLPDCSWSLGGDCVLATEAGGEEFGGKTP